MKPRTIRYYIQEAFRSLIVNRLMSIASIFAVASSIFIVAVFFVVGANVEHFMRMLEGTMGLAVFMDEDLSRVDQMRLERLILDINHVENVTFVTRDEALEDMRGWLNDDGLLRGFELHNPLRDSFVIELTDLAFQDEVVRALDELRAYGVDNIRRDEDIMGFLVALSGIVQVVSAVLILILGVISVIIITNTIRITVNARKTEINIMKYVGATDWFIRWPFVIEGMLIGLIGGAIPALILWLSYGRVVAAIVSIPTLAWLQFLPEEHIFIYVFPFCLILGTFIGLVGSAWSVGKHLKV